MPAEAPPATHPGPGGERGGPAPSPVIVALDAMPEARAVALARALEGRVWGSQVNDLLLPGGADVIPRLSTYGRVLVRIELLDIPNSLGNQVRRLAAAGAHMITVQLAGGAAMLHAAREARDAANPATRLLGVPVPAPCSAAQANRGRTVAEGAGAFGERALAAGLDGVLCAPPELGLLDAVDPGRRLLRVASGVRPADPAAADARAAPTPAAALAQGAHYLVVGHPITQAADPSAACARLLAELRDAR